MKVSVIVAVSENGVIGNKGQLPWRLPADLKFFKEVTMGHPILMGRKTYESIGKALPGRRNIVISRNPTFAAEGCEVHFSLGDALKACIGLDEVFIIGGGSVFEKAFDLSLVHVIYLTLVHGNFEGDTYFKVPDGPEWKTTSRERREPDEKNPYPVTFIRMERK